MRWRSEPANKVLQQLIKEFQIFIGYREQLLSQSGPIPHETWSVYLMAQSFIPCNETKLHGESTLW